MTTATAAPPATPGYRWPSGEPTWQRTILEQLSSAGSLGNVPPELLAGISYYTSDYGAGGVGINSADHGGYFGQGATWTYPGGKTSAALLRTPSPTAFSKEAEIAAATLSSYGHTPVGDLNTYATGTPGKSQGFTSWLEQNVLPSSNTATLTGLPWWSGAGLITKGAGAVGGAIGSGISHVVFEALLLAAGAALILFGLYGAAKPHVKAAAGKGAKAAELAGAAA